MKTETTTGALAGLKAEANTTSERPALRVVFLPRFWGSFEARWELGKNHLVPVTRAAGLFRPDFTLCGHAAHRDDIEDLAPSRTLETGAPLPAGICKKCKQVATKRGYGAK